MHVVAGSRAYLYVRTGTSHEIGILSCRTPRLLKTTRAGWIISGFWLVLVDLYLYSSWQESPTTD